MEVYSNDNDQTIVFCEWVRASETLTRTQTHTVDMKENNQLDLKSKMTAVTKFDVHIPPADQKPLNVLFPLNQFIRLLNL